MRSKVSTISRTKSNINQCPFIILLIGWILAKGMVLCVPSPFWSSLADRYICSVHFSEFFLALVMYFLFAHKKYQINKV